MNNTRTEKVSRLLQKELSSYFQEQSSATYLNSMISVTIVRSAPDLSTAKVFLSIFPPEKSKEVFKLINENQKNTRYQLSQRLRAQLRKVPEFIFALDDSLDYIENIDKLLTTKK